MINIHFYLIRLNNIIKNIYLLLLLIENVIY